MQMGQLSPLSVTSIPPSPLLLEPRPGTDPDPDPDPDPEDAATDSRPESAGMSTDPALV